MKTQALAQIPETKRADGRVVRLSDVLKVYKAGDVEVSRASPWHSPAALFHDRGPSGSGKTTLLNLIDRRVLKHPALHAQGFSDFVRQEQVGFFFKGLETQRSDAQLCGLSTHQAGSISFAPSHVVFTRGHSC